MGTPDKVVRTAVSGEAKGAYVAWQIPSMRHVVKQEFLAMAVRCNLSASGLLEDILVEWLRAQGVEVSDSDVLKTPAPCTFHKDKKKIRGVW